MRLITTTAGRVAAVIGVLSVGGVASALVLASNHAPKRLAAAAPPTTSAPPTTESPTTATSDTTTTLRPLVFRLTSDVDLLAVAQSIAPSVIGRGLTRSEGATFVEWYHGLERSYQQAVYRGDATVTLPPTVQAGADRWLRDTFPAEAAAMREGAALQVLDGMIRGSSTTTSSSTSTTAPPYHYGTTTTTNRYGY